MSKDYEAAERLVADICDVFNVDLTDITGDYGRRGRACFVRGIVCLYGYIFKGIHPETLCQLLTCTRANVINIARHYLGYYKSRDPEILRYITLIKDKEERQ